MLTIQKQGGLRSLVGWVKGRLIELFTFLGVFDIVTEYQIQMLATRICVKYYYWTTAELDYAFVVFTEGKLGKLYQHKHEFINKPSCTTVNPQEILVAFDSYEKELLAERGRIEDERKRQEEARKAAEDYKKPHGMEAWKIYCEKNNLDPSAHRIHTVDMSKHDVNQELYKDEEERKMAEKKFYRKDLRKQQ